MTNERERERGGQTRRRWRFGLRWCLGVLLVCGGAILPRGTGAEAAPALDLARQLNQAFIDVAEKVSPAVVVVRVAHKPNYVSPDEENPLFDLLPPDLRKKLEE